MNKLLIPIALALAVLAGCGKRTLNPSGVYKGNAGLFYQDETIASANSGLKTFLIWETRNRPLLPVEVSKFADKIRLNRFEWNQKAIRLRDAYAISPTPANGEEFKAALNELEQALIEATAIMTANAKGTH